MATTFNCRFTQGRALSTIAIRKLFAICREPLLARGRRLSKFHWDTRCSTNCLQLPHGSPSRFFFVTLSPLDTRPVITENPNIERFAAFAVAGLLFGLAYPRRLAADASFIVATKTIADFERGAREPYPRTLEDVREALEKAGAEFIDENGGGGRAPSEK
jgi:hypothetical protein